MQIIPVKHSQFLWRISWLCLLSGIYAIYKEHYSLAPGPLGIWVTSINYWRKPDYSWRRYLDIYYVHAAIIYHIIRAYRSQYAVAYYIFLGIGITFYPIGIYFHKRGDDWISTICHAQLHIFGNISNFILYSGYIVPITKIL